MLRWFLLCVIATSWGDHVRRHHGKHDVGEELASTRHLVDELKQQSKKIHKDRLVLVSQGEHVSRALPLDRASSQEAAVNVIKKTDKAFDSIKRELNIALQQDDDDTYSMLNLVLILVLGVEAHSRLRATPQVSSPIATEAIAQTVRNNGAGSRATAARPATAVAPLPVTTAAQAAKPAATAVVSPLAVTSPAQAATAVAPLPVTTAAQTAKPAAVVSPLAVTSPAQAATAVAPLPVTTAAQAAKPAATAVVSPLAVTSPAQAATAVAPLPVTTATQGTASTEPDSRAAGIAKAAEVAAPQSAIKRQAGVMDEEKKQSEVLPSPASVESAKVEVVSVDSVSLEPLSIDNVKVESASVDSEKIQAVPMESKKVEAMPVEEETVKMGKAMPMESKKVEAMPVEEETVKMAKAMPMESKKVEAMPVEEETVKMAKAMPMESKKVEAIPVEDETVKADRVEDETVEVMPVPGETVEVMPVAGETVEAMPVAAETVEALLGDPPVEAPDAVASVSVLGDWAYCTCNADGANGTLVNEERQWPVVPPIIVDNSTSNSSTDVSGPLLESTESISQNVTGRTAPVDSSVWVALAGSTPSLIQVNFKNTRVALARANDCECKNPWESFTDPHDVTACNMDSGVNLCIVRTKSAISDPPPEVIKAQAQELRASIEAEFQAAST